MMVVLERNIVAGLLAGVPAEGPACALDDEVLRALAVAARALQAHRRAPLDEDLVELARLQGVEVSPAECEQLRREGAMRRAA